MGNILTDFLVKVLAVIFPFALRKFYSPSHMAELLEIRLSNDGNGVEYWAGELPFAQTWIELTNLSPFPLELERVFGRFCFGTQLAAFTYLKRGSIKPSSTLRIPIHAELSTGHVAYISKNLNQNPQVSIYFNAHLLCSVRNISVERILSTTHYRLSNFDLPSNSVSQPMPDGAAKN